MLVRDYQESIRSIFACATGYNASINHMLHKQKPVERKGSVWRVCRLHSSGRYV